MSVSKVYIDNNILNDLKENMGSNHQVIWQSDSYCLKSLSLSSYGVLTMQISFKHYSNNNYYHYNNIVWSNDLGRWTFGSGTTNTTKPTVCLNGSVADPVFSSIATIHNQYELTNDYYYHPRFDSILIMFFIITLVCIYFPYKIFCRAFGRWLKV